MSEEQPIDGLMAAARVFAARCADPDPEPVAAFLTRHAALREWLEPMLDDAPIEDSPDPDSTAARTLGPYRLLGELGRGGMGVVYEAQRGDDPTPLALKILPDFLALHEGRVARFEREAELAQRLDHPGIVRVVAAGAVDTTRFLAMELIAGAPLDQVLAALRGRVPQELTGRDLGVAILAARHQSSTGEGSADVGANAFAGSYVANIVRLGVQVADALEHAHRAGVIHRDIKPSNILVRADGTAVLTDFGLARDADVSTLTITGDFAGTPYYVSPEQAMAKRVAVDHRTDLFSLGSTLYELLTLRRPFEGETTQAVLGKILTKEPPPPTRFHPGLAADLVTVIFKLLEKDPDRRYRGAAAVAVDLRAFLEYRPVAALRASSLTRVVRWTRREPLRAALAGVLALGIPVLAGGAGYLIARGDEIRAGRDKLRAQQVEARVEEAFLQFILEEPGLGIPAFEAALALDPTSAEAQVGLLFATMREGGAAAALARLDGPLAAHMQAGLLDLMRFGALLRLERTAEADAIEARLGEPRTEFELFVHGLVHRDRGDAAGTRLIEFTERAVLASKRPLLWLHLNWAVYADEARDGASGRRCAANLLLNWPDSPVAQYFACVALRASQPDRAADLVRQSLAAHPDSGLLHCADGMVQKSRGETARAVAAFERAVALSPRVPSFHYSLGSARFDAGDIDGAVAALRASTALSPRFVAGWLGLGMVQASADRLSDAEASLRHAVELHTTHGESRFQLGQVLVRMQRVDEALVELRQAVRLHSADPNKWMYLGSVLTSVSDADGALAALQRAVGAMPRYEPAHEALVEHLAQHGTPVAVRGALDAWVDAVPRSAKAWLQLATHCVDPTLTAEQRDAATGVFAARRSLALTKDKSALACLTLGDAYTLLGEGERARTAWERSLGLADQPLTPEQRKACEARLKVSTGK